ncbi:hypothetical protein CY35_06G025900 [Sphagnum magellanicum]|nr:hypothetical protein CY35_06G025900 [Sphagnum magellanicum]
MWQVKRRSLIATKLERVLKPVQKPDVSSRERPWIRASIREPESTLNPTLEGFGIHPIFQNPTAPRSKGINLDKLRELNMGHLNIQLHPQSQVSSVCASARSEYQRESEFNDANAEEIPVSKTPHAFVVPEGWRTLTLTPSKPRTADEQGNKRQLLALTDRAAASPFSSSSAKDVADSDVAAAEMKKFCLNLRKGFFTEDQGIGTARGASPYHKAEGNSVFNRNKCLALLLVYKQSCLCCKADLEIHKPITSFLRVPVCPGYRLPERISVEEQKEKLEKGGHRRAGFRAKIADQAMLAESFRRQRDPGVYKDEAKAIITMAEYPKALENYLRFLDLCHRIMDIEGEAMVLNFIGCSIQEEADIKVAASKTAIDFTVKEDEADMHPIVVQDTQYLKAIDFHKKHAAKTDIEGKFTAFTNLGIIYATLCIWTEAAKFHKKALRCATFVQSSPDQCIAVGNLGFLLFRCKKMVVAKACISRYLMICRMLGDTLGLARSHYTLGQIALQLKKFREAKVEFTAAMNAAIQHGDKQIETFCKVQLGICKGNVLIATREKALEGYHPETSPFVEIKR